MLFSLEAVHAREGDALLLHYGPADNPTWILIDGGSRGVYRSFLKPRIDAIRTHWDFDDDEPFPLRMVMVSHIDADHISGILDLFMEMEDARDRRAPVGYAIETLWHNGFDDLIGNLDEALVGKIAAAAAASTPTLPLPAMHEDTRAVVASTKQGRELLRLARKLDVPLNAPSKKLITAPQSADAKPPFEHGLDFLVIGPLRTQVEAYQAQWDKDLKKILKDEQELAQAAAFSDESPFNLASIGVLASMDGKSMLLTGDARGDYVIDGLVEVGKLADKDASMHVDLLKLPHHGSDRNVEVSFFEQITADRYIISADGRHHNPDVPTLQMLADARGDDSFQLCLTFEEKAFENTSSQGKKEALKAVHDWLTSNKRPPNCEIVYRKTDAGELSVVTNLGEALAY